MSVFSGNTSTTALSETYETGVSIISYSLTNRAGGAIVVSAAIFYGSTVIEFVRKSLNTNESFEYTGFGITIPSGRRIFISTNGSVDYYFSLE